VGLLQCKWAYQGENVAIAEPNSETSVQQILAALIHPQNLQTPNEHIEFWSRTDIANRVIKYARQLPLAMSLRIKKERYTPEA
jgi:hypothetical protein